ncbi:tRNA 2-thiouridine(34) synthase MnmA [Candidatus Phycosocius spiralis]|uniref:tRNA-specific 2-thiouridylase MnmA n=1 Tax=Candidatus Phycosocius spiralis TaxID=2815099 RepID=A0ABQ4PTA0_9PROT|nr:tRNA 2-thiouridine(34) synthase MnmA [Candidatus Phycosocius spiralis]GIU66218.1 tRNA-specific 2-thiouridylase MnmA [Candidatus Phycosocius spiralis]
MTDATTILRDGAVSHSIPDIELGIDKPRQNTRVVVAMSGGVDSSVVAALVQASGYETIGITLQLYDHGAAVKKQGACCAGQDIYDARRVADQIGIAHYVLDYESRFKEAVINHFADTYLAGFTPIPCVRCNQSVKFKDLLETAKDLGADCLATGHYVARVDGPQGSEMRRAADASRDQSYFLFATTREQLDYLRFPLAGLSKSAVREIAAILNLPVAVKPDSQDICFVPNGKYSEVVAKLRPGASEPGQIIHVNGGVLGEHEGVIHFTVGQRRGLGIATGEPLFVVKINAETKEVVVGPRASLAIKRMTLTDVNWIGEPVQGEDALHGRRILARVRSTRPPVPATLLIGAGWSVELDEPEEGVAPGQACVFYDLRDGGDRVLGGGWIGITSNQIEVSHLLG